VELIRSERKYRSLVEQSTDAIFLNKLDGQILDVNEKACKNAGKYQRAIHEICQMLTF
jgi:PAS domain S-box-containing protein